MSSSSPNLLPDSSDWKFRWKLKINERLKYSFQKLANEALVTRTELYKRIPSIDQKGFERIFGFN